MITILQQAKDPATDPQRLQRLSLHTSKEIQRAVASNPNTPVDVLCRLGADFPKEFWENPSLPLILLERPDLFEQVPTDTMERLLNKRELPGSVLEGFAKSNNPHVLARIARHHSTPPTTLAVLARSKIDHVRRDVAENENTPLEVLVALAMSAGYDSYYLNSRIAKNPNVSPELLWELATDGCYEAIYSKALPEEWRSILQLLRGIPNAERIIVQERNVTPEQRALFLKGARPARHFVLTDLSCPLEILEQIALEPREHYTNQETIELLLLHPKTTDQLQETIASLPEQYKRAALANSPKTTTALLQKLSQDASDHVAAFVAKNPNTPIDSLSLLANHPSVYVRANIARNTNAPDWLLRSLPHEPSVEFNLASRANCPEDILAKIAKSDDIHILRNMAQNTTLPASIFPLLLQCRAAKELIPSMVANTAIPIEILESLRTNEEYFARVAETTKREDLQRMIAGFQSWRIRAALAASRNARPEILTMLAKDKIPSVKKAALKNPNRPKKRAKKA